MFLRKFLIDGPMNAQDKAETELRREAYKQAVSAASGLGGLKDAAFYTPQPWKYETSSLRRVAWRIYCLLDQLIHERRSPTYYMPLRSAEYAKGKLVVFTSGVEIKKLGKNETTSYTRAYFEHYPSHP